MKTFKLFGWLFIASSFLIMAACSGGGSSGGSVETGTLSLSMTDASCSDYKAVFVTIDEVQVHLGGNGNSPNHWKSVDMPISPLTVNLFDLVNGVREDLGLVDLDAGPYTQMRLIIGEEPDDGINMFSESHPFANYVIDESDTYHELKIPSGFQTGIKIVHKFEISDLKTTELILDFNACDSVVQAGDSGNWLLKPTIKVLDTEEMSIINGIVTRDDSSGIDGVLVSVQVADPEEDDEKDKVLIQTATITDENGNYSIFVQPGTYNLLFSKDGFLPDCAEVIAEKGSTKVVPDFILFPETAYGTVICNVVVIEGATEDQHVTLSFRQIAQCDCGGDETIEVKSNNVVH